MPELVVSPGATDDSGLVQRMLRLAQPGETLLLRDGVYARQLVTGRTFADRVTVRGESRAGVVLDSLVIQDCRGLAFENLSVRPGPASWGITVRGGGQLAFRRLTLDGAATTTTSGRGIVVYGDGEDPAKWPAGITIERCSIARFAADLICLFGARDAIVDSNILYWPQQNEDHNDGIQITACDGFRLERNSISCPPATVTGSTPPDQAIILSTIGTQKISRGIVAGNRIRNWPGTALLVAGVVGSITDVTIYGNEMLAARGGLNVAANVAAGVEAYANPYLSSGPAPPFPP